MLHADIRRFVLARVSLPPDRPAAPQAADAPELVAPEDPPKRLAPAD